MIFHGVPRNTEKWYENVRFSGHRISDMFTQLRTDKKKQKDNHNGINKRLTSNNIQGANYIKIK